MKKCFLFLTILFLFLIPHKAFAFDSSISIDPPLFQIHTLTPSSFKASLSLTNNGTKTIELIPSFKPFLPAETENGEISPIDIEHWRVSDPFILEKIILLYNDNPVQTITLAPQQKKELNLSVTLPEDEPPGEYYFSILFVSKSIEVESNTSTTSVGIASNVLLTVGEKGETKGFLEEFSSPFLLQKGPVNFLVKAYNGSSYFIRPRGVIVIKNMFNQIVGNIELQQVNILSSSSRFIPSSLSSQYAVWDEGFLLGPYSAELTLALSEKGPVFVKKIYFIGMPVFIIFVILLSASIIAIIYSRVKRKL